MSDDKGRSGEECVRAMYDTIALLQDAISRSNKEDVKKYGRMLYCLAQNFTNEPVVIKAEPKEVIKYVYCDSSNNFS